MLNLAGKNTLNVELLAVFHREIKHVDQSQHLPPENASALPSALSDLAVVKNNSPAQVSPGIEPLNDKELEEEAEEARRDSTFRAEDQETQILYERYIHEQSDALAQHLEHNLIGYKTIHLLGGRPSRRANALTRAMETTLLSLLDKPNRGDNLHDILSELYLTLVRRLREMRAERNPHPNICAFVRLCAKRQYLKWSQKRAEAQAKTKSLSEGDGEGDNSVVSTAPPPDVIVNDEEQVEKWLNLLDTLYGLKFAAIALNSAGDFYAQEVRDHRTTIEGLAARARVDDRAGFRRKWEAQEPPWDDYEIAQFYPALLADAQTKPNPRAALQMAIINARTQARIELSRRPNLFVSDEWLREIWLKLAQESLPAKHAQVFFLHCERTQEAPLYSLLVLLDNRKPLIGSHPLQRQQIAERMAMETEALDYFWKDLPLPPTVVRALTGYSTVAVVQSIYGNVRLGVQSILERMYAR